VVENGSAAPRVSSAKSIHKVGEALSRNLIALATCGRGGLRRMVLGSVADKVIRGASTPALLYHPR